MIRFFTSIINNYYWIYVLIALLLFIGFRDMYFIAILGVISTLFFCSNYKPLKWNGTDSLILIFIVYQLISYFFSDYKLSIWYYGVKGQVIPILFYYLGRNKFFYNNRMLENMRYPIVFAMAVGLILYFWQPDWYIARRTASLTSISSENSYHEVTRLSSFWPWSYAMGYGSLFYIMYFIKDLFYKKIKLQYILYLFIALATLFFAQQRVSIAFFLCFLIFITFFIKTKNKKRIIYLWSIIFVFILIAVFYLINYADESYIEYILNRSIDSEDNLIESRFGMFSSFWDISLFGDGLGRYGHAVLLYNMKSITDCEYIRIMAELGIIGSCIFFIIYLKSIFIAFYNRKQLLFEFLILSFYLAAMIGATPLENASMQPFLFWYCIGRISSPDILNKLI